MHIFLAWITMAVAMDTPMSARFATFNVRELSSAKLNQLDERGKGANKQLRSAAEVVQRVRPDILLINEIDFDAAHRKNAAHFSQRYLEVSQSGLASIHYPHIFFEPVNTGLRTDLDLDKDGKTGGPADAIGYGRYPGQYGMALFSKFPIDRKQARTFQKLLWKHVPGNLIPDGREGRPILYSADDLKILRLSSKSHWVVPIKIRNVTLQVLCSHPTPPVFDGPEDRNGRRTFDEIRLLADLVRGGSGTDYLVDDQGRRGPLKPGALFVILGDLNAEPVKDPAPYGRTAVSQILDLECVQDPLPRSAGAASGKTPGPPRYPERRTSNFGRIDYVLPSVGLDILDAGVFWPKPSQSLSALVTGDRAASDHRLVWVDVRFRPAAD